MDVECPTCDGPTEPFDWGDLFSFPHDAKEGTNAFVCWKCKVYIYQRHAPSLAEGARSMMVRPIGPDFKKLTILE